MYVKRCDKVAQENVGTDFIKRLPFLSHASLDQLSIVVAMRTGLIGVTQPVTVLKPIAGPLESSKPFSHTLLGLIYYFRTPYFSGLIYITQWHMLRRDYFSNGIFLFKHCRRGKCLVLPHASYGPVSIEGQEVKRVCDTKSFT